MACNPATRRQTVRRAAVALTSWVVAAGVAQGVLGGPIGRATRPVQHRIEMQLKGTAAPAAPLPQRSHEEESFESWELVGV